jgi:predicted nuclease of restriction endonuclease-like (RecB) superfamily
MKLDKAHEKRLNDLITKIRSIVIDSRKNIARSINSGLLKTYWTIGKHIIEFEQKGKIKAEYGKQLLLRLSKSLTVQLGRGFSRSNLSYMRLLYLRYPKCETLSHKLSWSHYYELLKIDGDLERDFYEKQAINENWAIRELKRQVNSALFHRLALSKDKAGILKLSRKGQIVELETDIIKDPYVLEFLNIPERNRYSEKDLESKIINNLQNFLLELGKGFAFIARQYRVTLNNTHYYIDLLFYHRILKCFVLIDLKVNDVKHQDIGQMNMYLNYFITEENVEDDNPPIGIILSTKKDEVMVEYATGGISNKIFVSKYQLYLPDKKMLAQKVKELIAKE